MRVRVQKFAPKILLIFALVAAGALYTIAEEWKKYETNYTVIHYRKDDDLYKFTLRTGGFKFTKEGLDDSIALAKFRVDKIMDRVQALLDMYPPGLKIKILSYPDYASLGEQYRGYGNTGKPPIAFYLHKKRTIFLSVDSITDGMLAHEMAHAVINAFFSEPPPKKMQEVLAQYVDRHLWSSNR